MTNQERRYSWPLPFGERAELDLEYDTGSIEVMPVAPGEAPRVEASGRNAHRLEVDVQRDGNTVRVRIDRENGFGFIWRSNDELRVWVPREIAARVHADAGSIEVRDLGPCELDLGTDAGRLRLENVHGRLKLSTDAGQISGRGLGGSIEAETDAGQIHLQIDALNAGEHHISTDVGQVKIEMAPGLEVRIETRAGLGSVRNEYPSSPTAAAILHISTDVGSVRVRSTNDAESDGSHHGSDHGQRAERREMRHEMRDERRADRWARRAGPEHRPIPPIPPIPPLPPIPPFAPGFFGRHEEEVVRDEGTETATRSRADTDTEMERILKMVEDGTLSASDADELLRALE